MWVTLCPFVSTPVAGLSGRAGSVRRGSFLGVRSEGRRRASGCRMSASAGQEAVSFSGTLLRGLNFLLTGEPAHSSYTGLSSGVKGDSVASGIPAPAFQGQNLWEKDDGNLMQSHASPAALHAGLRVASLNLTLFYTKQTQ